MDRASDTAWQQLLNYVLLLVHARLGSSQERMSGTVLKSLLTLQHAQAELQYGDILKYFILHVIIHR